MLRFALIMMLVATFASAQEFKHLQPSNEPASGRPSGDTSKEVDPNAQTAVDSLTQVSELFRAKPKRPVGEQTFDSTSLAPYTR